MERHPRRLGLEALATRFLGNRDSFDLVALMTLILLLFFVSSYWYVSLPVLLLAIAGILQRSWRQSANFWFAITAILVCGNLQQWFTIDNHKYLIAYWCLALHLALRTGRPSDSLARVAHLLIGLVFFFATLWKLLTPDFVDGRFFYFELLTDGRFETVAKILGGASGAQLSDALRAEAALHRLGSTLGAVELGGARRLEVLARAMTVWTLLAEGIIALTFCWPRNGFISRVRDIPLLLFLASTYISAAVVGFGWVLSIMGVAQSHGRNPKIAALYVLVFLAIFAYSGPWGDFIGELAGTSHLAGSPGG